MNISAPFIHRPVMTTLIFVALAVLGYMSYSNLPVSNLPDVNYPTINVTASLPGANPDTMANTVAAPMEREFMTIPGITNVTSSSTLGNTTVVLQFDITKSMDSAAQDVEAAISRALPNLPPNLPNAPTYKKVNPSSTPILYIALTSNVVTRSELYTYGHTFIGQRISMLNGVAQVTTYGSPYAVRVQVDPGKLASLGVTLEETAIAINSGNPTLPTGQLDGNFISSNIIANGQLEHADVYQPLVIAYRNGAPIRVEDLGRAIDSLQNDRINLEYVEANKRQSTVVLAIQRQPDANTVEVSDEIQKFLPSIAKELPAAIEMIVIFDRSVSIRESISEVKFTLVIAFILVVLVIFLYLGNLTDTIIPAVIMPMSIIATFIVMWFMHYTVDNLSLLALILAIGFIIDDAIIVIENIVRRVEQGETPWEASINGSQQIGFTIVSMSVSLIAVFIPMLFMSGLVGKIFQEFSVTLVSVTVISGIIALTLTPMLCSRFIKPRDREQQTAVERFSNRFNEWMLSYYKPLLKWVIEHPFPILLTGLLCVLFTGLLFYSLPTDFIPDDDIGFIIGYSQAEQGTSSERMGHYQNAVADIIQKDPSVASFVSISASPDFRNGISFIRLKPRSERPSITAIIQNLYQELSTVTGVNVFLKNVPLIDLSQGVASKSAYQYTLQSINKEALYETAEKLIEKMKNDPIFQAVNSDFEISSPQLYVDILRNQASALGVTAAQIENALLLAFSGNRVSRIQTPLDQYDVILEVERSFQRSAASLGSIYVRSSTTDQFVPLDAVASWKQGIGPASVSHISQFPAVTISFNTAPNVPLGTALQKVRDLAEESFVPGVTGKVQGSAQTFEESIKNSSYLLIVAIFCIYIFLGILYESFIHPLTILSTLPPALLGGLATLYLLHLPLSLYGYLGLILLIGIVKKNGIMVVDYALENIRAKHESPEQSIFEACTTRFRPIMMTTMATIAGAIPIALAAGGGADARRPLGFVIIGGMIFSQLVTLFLTPVIYLYLERWNENLAKKRAQKV